MWVTFRVSDFTCWLPRPPKRTNSQDPCKSRWSGLLTELSCSSYLFCIYVKLLSSSLEQSEDLNIKQSQALEETLWYFSHILDVLIMPLPLSELCLTFPMRILTPLLLLNYKSAFSNSLKSIIMPNNRNL